MSEAPKLGRECGDVLAREEPVVALESALITHGFAYPANLQIARAMAQAVRAQGAIPVPIGIWEGPVTVGLSDAQIADLAADRTAIKVSVRICRWCGCGVRTGERR